ncbi:MAG: hypothetical protein AAF684_05280, partial [Pseudomonadota bacterium]
MTFRVALIPVACAFALAGCSLDAPSPFGGDARVNGAPLSGAAARALETSPTRRIVVTAPGCEAAELAVDGPLDADGVVAA